MQIKTFMTQKHRNCDELFSTLENSVVASKWADAENQFPDFAQSFLHHFQQEEEVMFPAIEAQMGGQGGPPYVMRMEHQQIRQIITQMETALRQHQQNDFLGFSDTLMILVQQHNMKEEQILYPMADQMLDASHIVSEMEKLP